MEPRAYALHAARDPDGRARARQRLQACGLQGYPWPLVEGSALSSTDLDATVGAHLFDPPYPLALGAEEVAHFLTHRQVWADMQRRGLSAALILDAPGPVTPEPFDEAMDLALAHLPRLGLIELRARPSPGPADLIDARGEATLTVPQQTEGRAPALLIGLEAARHLLALSDRIDRPVETFLHSHWHTGLRCATLSPSGIAETAATGGIAPPSGAWPRLRHDLAQRKYLRAVARLSRNSAAPPSGGLIT